MTVQLYNYTRIMTREQQMYVRGKELSLSMSTGFVKILLATTIPTTAIGYFIAGALDKSLFNPLLSNWSPGLLIASVGIGLLLGTALWKIMIGGYRLIEYLRAYFRPKKSYTNSHLRGDMVFRLTNIHIDSIVKSRL